MHRRNTGAAAVGVGGMAVGLALAGCSASGDTSGDPVTGQFTDGTYDARGWYGGLPSHHDVTLTIADDIVTAVEITTPAEDPTSLGYQQRFAAALPDAIIGQRLDAIDVDRLAGSSGCSEGFMDALTQIEEDART